MAKMTCRPALVCLAALALAGCRSAPAELVVALPSGPTTLDPVQADEEFTYTVLANVYQSLVEIDEDLRLRPSLAQSWLNPDERTLIFHLRQDARTHDGREVTAADVTRSLLAMRDSGRLMEGDAIDRVEPVDLWTVRVRTRRPAPQIVYSVGLARLSWPEPGRPGSPVGSGPYRVVAWTPGGDTRLETAFPRSPDAPRVTGLTFRAVAPGPERVQRLKAGEVHLAMDVPAADFQALGKTPGIRTAARRGLRVLLLGMDCGHEASPHVDAPRNPFRDVRVRRAVALAVDRDDLVAHALGGLADPADQIVAPEVSGYVPGLPPPRHDPREARRLLREAGFADGFAVALDYVPEKYRAAGAVAERLAAQLAAVGVRLRLRPLPLADYLNRLDAGDSALFFEGWMTLRDASLSYDLLLHSPLRGRDRENSTGFSDPEMDGWIEVAKELPRGPEQMEQLRRIAERVRRDSPLLPLYRQHDLYAWSTAVEFAPYLDRSIYGVRLGWVR